MSQVIGQVWREVVGCRNWPVMRVPQFIALRRNGGNLHVDFMLISAWIDMIITSAKSHGCLEVVVPWPSEILSFYVHV